MSNDTTGDADYFVPLINKSDSDLEEQQGDDFDSDHDFEISSPFSSPSMKMMLSPQMRADHLQTLLMKRKTTDKYLDHKMRDSPSASTESLTDQAYLSETTKQRARHERVALQKVETYLKELKRYFDLDANTVQIHLKGFCYKAKVNPATETIHTVYNRGICYKLSKWLKRRRTGAPTRVEKVDKVILDDINLVLKPSKMYLVLGPPGSGKSALLRAIAGRLSMSNGETTEGSVTYNGLSLQDKSSVYIENAISFIGQSDFHHSRLTVEETFEFAWECKTGATHASKDYVTGTSAEELIQKLDREKADVKAKLDALDLGNVAHTFVGDSEVRGVSGGQRRRVSVGEMMPLTTAPVLCGDEITTGLDAASAYQLLFLLTHYTRVHKMTRIISLLQPTPETVSLFDDIILLAKGKILYTGPIGNVGSYFASLGYHPPDQMDIADFLQMIPTPDGKELFKPSPEQKAVRATPYSIDELAAKFRESYNFQRIQKQLAKDNGSYQHQWSNVTTGGGWSRAIMQASLKHKYANSFLWSAWLLFKRNIILWLRDRRFLIVNFIKNVIMGLSVGGVFFQTEAISSIYGALFQLNLFIMLGAMVVVPDQVSDRSIYYKHVEANFYGAFPYVLGRALALLPQTFIDIMIFGSIIYWMVGLAPTGQHFFIYIAILFVFSLVMNQMLSIFAAVAKTKTEVQGAGSCVLLMLILTCGFIVTPDNIPPYYRWIYWWNPLAWAYRGLLVNEFSYSGYDEISEVTGRRIGDDILVSTGFVDGNGEPFGQDWIGYSFAYMVPFWTLCTIISGLCLKYIRVEGITPNATSMDDSKFASEKTNGHSSNNGSSKDIADEEDSGTEMTIPFKPVTLSFQNVCYEVAASKGKETLRLLNNVDGLFESGKMIALMGSSGSGKTTLLDVLALRKNTGRVTGDVKVNGFPQDEKSFRRCSGYVEQFDVQAPELTVRETVLYSARLRLDPSNPAFSSDEDKVKFVDQVLRTLELESIADWLVGDSDSGLSFEQRKRLSIAVELAASPSILFLDEPTSGLEARAALLVVETLRRIADEGRTIIATIHQPSYAVFRLFDDLLLLKKGGRVVFFGELGPDCSNLVNYFEKIGAHSIDRGENPASWMLSVVNTETQAPLTFVDFAQEYKASNLYLSLQKKLLELDYRKDPTQRVYDENEFAADTLTRRLLINTRLRTIYWRSPAYNRQRMVIYALIALILGSIFFPMMISTPGSRVPDYYSETLMTSLLSTTFISFIITGVLAINSVLPVMLKIRDSFYRQRQSGMVDDVSFSMALGVAEKWFIVMSSFLFCVVFLPCAGIGINPGRAISFSGIFCFNTAIYSYAGQAFMCLVPGMPQAQILASIFIGLNNFFSGLIVRPQYLTGFFAIPFWITPGHYVYEGLVVSLFYNLTTPVLATEGSAFYYELGCSIDDPDPCFGTVWGYVDYFFGGRFQRSHLYYDILVLGFILTTCRVVTFLALKHFNFTAS